jgi:hypothetical protein
MQFIGSDSIPTQLYSRFKTDGGRSQAAFEGLKNAFSEMFRRNEYIHRADEGSIKDVIVEITGLKNNDRIVGLILSTFETVRGFIASDASLNSESVKSGTNEMTEDRADIAQDVGRLSRTEFGLSYQINIVLPETDNISVFNAIFKSLKENLLQ